METKITQDTLELIATYLSPISRLNLASINETFLETCTRWRDIKTIVFDDDCISLAGPNFVHKCAFDGKEKEMRLNCLRTSMDMCPATKRFIIQSRLQECDIEALNNAPVAITKLYISTENLDVHKFPKFERLRTLHIVANSSNEFRIMNVIGQHILTSIFPNSLRRICLTDIYLTENLISKITTLPNLLYLDMIGCLVDTSVGSNYIKNLETCENLEELSLPPSLFSFTKSSATFSFSLKKFKISKLSLYMDLFDEETFEKQLNEFLPSKLKILVVFGNYIPLKRWKKLKDIKKPLILFGPNESIASCPQANLTNVKLLSHHIRRPPYIPNNYDATINHQYEFPIERLSWRFNLSEWQNNETSSNAEIMAFRRRSGMRNDNSDILFEGIHIRPAVENPPPIGLTRPDARQITRRTNRTIPMRRRSAPGITDRAGRMRNIRTPNNAPRTENQPVTRTESLQTQAPSSPIGTRTGAVLNDTLQSVSPIRPNTDTAQPSTSTNTTLNNAFTTAPQTPNTITSNAITPITETRNTNAPNNSEAGNNRGARIEPTDEGMQEIVEMLSTFVNSIIPQIDNNPAPNTTPSTQNRNPQRDPNQPRQQ